MPTHSPPETRTILGTSPGESLVSHSFVRSLFCLLLLRSCVLLCVSLRDVVQSGDRLSVLVSRFRIALCVVACPAAVVGVAAGGHDTDSLLHGSSRRRGFRGAGEYLPQRLRQGRRRRRAPAPLHGRSHPLHQRARFRCLLPDRRARDPGIERIRRRGLARRHRTRTYWAHWERWFLGNALAALIVTPFIFYWVLRPSDQRNLSSAQWLEAAILLAGLIVSLTFAFQPASSHLGFADSRMYAPVAFLFWAAVRFGMRGATAATALLTIFAVAAAHVRGWVALQGVGGGSRIRTATVPVVARGAFVPRGRVARAGAAHPAFAAGERTALSRHGRQRAGDDLDYRRGRGLRIRQQGLARFHRSRACRRSAAMAGHKGCIPTTASAAWLSTSRVSSARCEFEMDYRLAAHRRRVSLGPGSRRAAIRRDRRISRLHRFGARRHRSTAAGIGAATERRAIPRGGRQPDGAGVPFHAATSR